jgi:hypothetical protein
MGRLKYMVYPLVFFLLGVGLCHGAGRKEPVPIEREEFKVESPADPETTVIRQPPPPPEASTPVYTRPILATPTTPVMDLFTAYYQEFNERLWIMLRLESASGIVYGGSFFFDAAGGIEPNYNRPTGRIEIEQGWRDTWDLTIYFSFQTLPGNLTGTRGSLRFFKLVLSSEQIYSYIVQRRNGVTGFELYVKEIPRSEIP